MELSPEGRELVCQFFANLDEMLYPQPIVGAAVDAAQTDLNMWRKRVYIPPEYWHKNGRVTYTGRGLLFAKLMEEMVWMRGPTRSAEVAATLMGYVDNVKEAVAVGDFSFTGDVLHFGKDGPGNGEDRAKYVAPGEPKDYLPKLFYKGMKPDLIDYVGWPMRIASEQAIRENPVPSSLTVLIPIGRELAVAALRAVHPDVTAK